MQIAKVSLFDKICIACEPGTNANCKNIYDEIKIAEELKCKLQEYLYLTKYALLEGRGPMQLAKIYIAKYALLVGWGPMQIAKIFITNFASLVGQGLMQMAKMSMMKYKLLKSLNANCKNISI